jgi:dihydrofolate reductase
MPNTHVFVGASLDGFIAGSNDELDWLGGGEGDAKGQAEARKSFDAFFAKIGTVLMGRRTYDIVCGLPGPWLYGDTPMLIATSKPLESQRPTVRAVSGSIGALVAEAKQSAKDRDVYVDGGQLIRSALDADLIDEITIAIIPIVLGAGIPLFAGAARRHPLKLIGQRTIAGAAVELKYQPGSRD